MALVIAYESSINRMRRALSKGWDDTDPEDVAFTFPDDAKEGDRILYFVGGKLQQYVGSGTVTSNWRLAKTGSWKGHHYIRTSRFRPLPNAIPGGDVESITGFRIPKNCAKVPVDMEEDVWRAARGKKLIRVELAMEGATTEARSRRRNAKLRETAILNSNGFCEGCGVNFWRKSGGLGRHCLVVHHKNQLKDRDEPRETKLSELAVVCANCHMMIHADPQRAMKLSELRKKLGVK
jgi:hypothetical protein